MLVGSTCMHPYSITILEILPKNLLGPPYVRYTLPDTEYVSKYSLRMFWAGASISCSPNVQFQGVGNISTGIEAMRPPCHLPCVGRCRVVSSQKGWVESCCDMVLSGNHSPNFVWCHRLMCLVGTCHWIRQWSRRGLPTENGVSLALNRAVFEHRVIWNR